MIDTEQNKKKLKSIKVLLFKKLELEEMCQNIVETTFFIVLI